MNDYITHTAPIEQVLDLIDRAITTALSIFSAAVGYGSGSWVYQFFTN